MRDHVARNLFDVQFDLESGSVCKDERFRRFTRDIEAEFEKRLLHPFKAHRAVLDEPVCDHIIKRSTPLIEQDRHTIFVTSVVPECNRAIKSREALTLMPTLVIGVVSLVH